MNPQPVERLEKTLARVAKEQDWRRKYRHNGLENMMVFGAYPARVIAPLTVQEISLISSPASELQAFFRKPALSAIRAFDYLQSRKSPHHLVCQQSGWICRRA